MSLFVKDMNEKGLTGLAREYHDLDHSGPVSAAHTAFTMNMMKNRYSGEFF